MGGTTAFSSQRQGSPHVNEEILKTPKMVNEDPHGKGWIVIIDPSDLEEDLPRLVKGDQAIGWLNKDISEVAKEVVP